MNLEEGKLKFIETWGGLAGSWGVTKTMAQIHALLLISTKPLCADQVISELGISRGNANMNLRELIDWELIVKTSREGDRKEYFEAEKDIWEVFRKIAVQRKKRELEPVVIALDELASVEAGCQESDAFCKMVKDLKLISCRADKILEQITKKESSWLVNGLVRLTN